MTNMEGKVAAITGAGGGLGREIAIRLARDGARVALLGRTPARLEQTAQAIGEAALAITCDVAEPSQVCGAFARIADAFGGVDILVNNAATYTPFLLEQGSDEALRATFDTSKAALENLGLGLRSELRADRIRVTTLRIGSMTGNESAQHWAPAMLEQFIAAIQASGHAAFAGAGISPAVVADHLAHALALPREANLDLIELRAV